MFSRKSNSALQRKAFSLTRSQISEDIEAICASEEHRNKLFVCLDDKPPANDKYAEMQNFIEATTKLEDMSKVLKTQIEKLYALAEELTSGTKDIENKIETQAEFVNLVCNKIE